MGVDMPITVQTYQILYEGKTIQEALKDLMERPKKNERECTWVVS